VAALVIDASATVGALFPDERNVRVDAVLAQVRDNGGLVPGHWWFEIRNALLMAERRGRASSGETAEFLASLRDLPISVALLPDEAAVFTLARRHRLTFYDAAYLELAKREGLALATFDRDLVAAARAERVAVA